jgi:hypothetical protein
MKGSEKQIRIAIEAINAAMWPNRRNTLGYNVFRHAIALDMRQFVG